MSVCFYVSLGFCTCAWLLMKLSILYLSLEFYNNNWVASCNDLNSREVLDEMC